MVSHRDSDWLAGAPTAAGRCAAAEGGATCSGEAQGEGVYDATSPMRYPASRYRPASRSESRGGHAVRRGPDNPPARIDARRAGHRRSPGERVRGFPMPSCHAPRLTLRAAIAELSRLIRHSSTRRGASTGLCNACYVQSHCRHARAWLVWFARRGSIDGYRAEAEGHGTRNW